MKKILFFVFIITFQFSFSQNITQNIKGIVIDKVSEKPLQGVTVSLQSQKILTNENGIYMHLKI